MEIQVPKMFAHGSVLTFSGRNNL